MLLTSFRRKFLKALLTSLTRFLAGALTMDTSAITETCCRRRFQFIAGADSKSSQAPIPIHHRRPSRCCTGAHLDAVQAPHLDSVQAPHLDSLQAPISIHHKRPSRFITGAHLDSLQAPISIRYRRPSQFPTGAATIADKHQFNFTQTRSQFLTRAIPRAH